MRKIWVLTKALLKSGGAFTNKNKGRQWWVPLLLGIAFLSFAGSVGLMAMGFFEVMAPLGAQGAIIPLAMGATSAVIFIFGVFYVISVMYHADDVQLLLGLPLRPYQILGAKFLTLVIYEYIFESFILLPILVVYGIMGGVDAAFIVYSVVLFAILPVIALSMAAVLVMLVMRFTSFGKNKQAFKFIGGIIAMVLAIGLNVGLQSAANNFTPEQLISGSASLVGMTEQLFPGIGFASEALLNSMALTGLWNMLLFVLCSAAAVGVFLALGQLLYFKGLAGVAEAAGKRRALSAEELGKNTAGTSATRSYVGKEIKMLMRSPVAFLNCVAMNFIWPVLVIVMLISGGGSLSTLSESIGQFDAGGIVAVLVGASAFISSGNAITSTAISREGRSLYFMKYIPMPMEKQLMAKVYSGMLLSAIGIVLLAVIAAAVGVNLLTALAALVLSLLASAVGALVGLLIDAARPKLDWLNEQQAIKQNINVMLHMLVGLLITAAVIVPVLILGMTLAMAIVYIVVLLGVAALLMWRGVVRGSAARISAMDA